MKTKKHKKRASLNKRMVFLGVVVSLCMAALLINIGYITATYGADFERYAVSQLIIHQNVQRVIPPTRGNIMDRNRQPLVDNERVYNVALDVTVLHSLEPRGRNTNPQEYVLMQINQILDIPMATLWDYMATDLEGNLLRPNNWRIIARQVPAYTALKLNEVNHVYLEPDTVRRFPDPFLAPQVLGFVRGGASWGLELQYQREMTGDSGRVFRSFQQDSATFTEEVPARDGYTLVTTLDAGIQRIVQRAVEDAAGLYQAQYTGIIIMNPNTGEILAMAQWPSFPLDTPDDGSRFTDPNIAHFWNYMDPEEQLAHMNRIWRNFSLHRTFEPGSIFKPFVMAAALEEGAISDMSHFYCTGVRQVADWAIHCHNRPGCGSLNLVSALARSCNIAPIDIVQSIGRETFYRYRNDFGFGERTGIDLPGEEAVSGPGVMYTLQQLNPVELATSSFGQGFNNTAIQAINAFASLINGGYVMRPYVVSQIVDAQGNIVSETTPTVVRNVLSRQTSDFIRQSMQAVVELPYGTGRRVFIDGYSIGGKTGTGQQGAGRDWIVTSFLGYMPVENPQFLAMGIVYNPENTDLTAGSSAALMIRDVFEQIIEYRQLPPAGAEQITGTVLDATGEVLPDFSGMELRDVTPILINMGVNFDISRSGSVISHHIPAAGQAVPRETRLVLYLDNNTDDLNSLTYMPSVEGLPEDRAVEMIIEAGLIPVIITPIGRGNLDGPITEEYEQELIIEQQSPRAGVHIQRGTQVRLMGGVAHAH